MRVALSRYIGWSLLLLGLVFLPAGNGLADTNSPIRLGETSSDTESLRAYLALQEQVRATQVALEKNRQETEAVAVRRWDLVLSWSTEPQDSA